MGYDSFMSTLIAIVIFGLGFAFIAMQNTASTAFSFMGYSWAMPVYMIAFGALLVGFFLSWIFSSISTLGNWSNMHGKNNKIREGEQTVTKLQSKIRELELENAKLQGHNETSRKEVVVERPVAESKPRNFLDRFKRNPAY